MANVQTQILEKIKEHEVIIIHRHQNPDPDAYGSQGGLQYVIEATFPEKKVYVVGEEVEGLKFLNEMHTIDDSVYEGALVIVTDTANTPRISDDRFDKGAFLIKIDHHPNDDVYGDLVWVDTTYSSASEMIVDLVEITNHQLQLNDKAARLLYAGIVGDTGRFLYDGTTSRTLRLASRLKEYDFKPKELYDNFYRITRENARLHGYILQNHAVTEKGVASMFLSQELINEFQVEPVQAANSVNVLSNIEGNRIWVFFIEYPNEIRVRIRSGSIVINGVAKLFGGGGHPLASGAAVQTKEEAKELILALDALLD